MPCPCSPLRVAALASLLAASSPRAEAQQVQVEEFTLDNGMTFLLLPRSDQPNSIAAGWAAKVGSVNERPGITGISHFFEHMMFKGTDTIGTRDPVRDAELRAQQTAVRRQINELIWGEQYRRYRAGEIDDPWNPQNDTEELRKLRAELKRLMAVQQGTVNAEPIKKLESELAKLKDQTPTDTTKIETLEAEIKRLNSEQRAQSTIVKSEFDSIYTKLGGSGMNAFTANDLTFYFINVPSNKFELWAWMESDRLMNSVFREFYAERDVVHEERRLRTESTPTGVFQEQFEAMFWQSSPYSWPVIGWPSDLNSYTMEEAQRYFETYYAPNNLVGVVVGDFKPETVKPLIREYFGRLARGPEPPPVVTLEMPQTVEMRMYAECDCPPSLEIRYHTVPFNHADSFPLEIMASILNGRTGRLFKSLVEEKKLATDASASAGDLGAPVKYAGYFAFRAEARAEIDPEALEEAWYIELERLKHEPVPERELQKIKNQVAADAFRGLQNNFFLMLQLGYYEAVGDAGGGWEYINEAPRKLQAVTAADIQRVAEKYFDWKNRCVAIYLRKAGAEAEDPELAGLDVQQRAAAKQLLVQLEKYDAESLGNAIAELEGRLGQIPQEYHGVINYVLKRGKERLRKIEAGEIELPKAEPPPGVPRS